MFCTVFAEKCDCTEGFNNYALKKKATPTYSGRIALNFKCEAKKNPNFFLSACIMHSRIQIRPSEMPCRPIRVRSGAARSPRGSRRCPAQCGSSQSWSGQRKSTFKTKATRLRETICCTTYLEFLHGELRPDKVSAEEEAVPEALQDGRELGQGVRNLQ